MKLAIASCSKLQQIDQFAEPNFAALLSDLRLRNKRVIAIYDDHDFIGNNRYGGDHSPALGLAARAEFVRAFTPAQTHADVYSCTRIGPADIIVLDERMYRRAPGKSASSRVAILGARQWSWFESAFRTSDARFVIVASSSTVHRYRDESWEQYPAAFERLRALISGRSGAVVVSGDIHRNAVYDDSGIVELTTSAVARKGMGFGGARGNYCVLEFDGDVMRVDLRSLKAGGRYRFEMSRNNWQIP